MVNEASPDGIRVLQPQEIAARVRKLVEEAKETLLLVSPYFKPWPQMQGEIERAAKRGVAVHLVVRRDKVAEFEAPLAPFHGCRIPVLSVEKLHAKLYVNERAAILTSMNLVDASAQESWEAGILVEEAKARGVYERIRQQAEDCVDAGEQVPAPGRPAAKPARARAASAAVATPTQGTCLRCAKAIRLDPEKPLCLGCFGKWVSVRSSTRRRAAQQPRVQRGDAARCVQRRAAAQARGVRDATCDSGVVAMRASTSRRYALGSTPALLQLSTIE